MDALLERALRYARPSTTGWWRGDCPYCEDKLGTPGDPGNLSAHVASGKWMCWRCGSKGYAPDMPDLMGHDSTRHKVSAARAVLRAQPCQPPEEMVSLADPAARWAHSLAQPFAYLTGRAVGDRTIEEADIGYVPAGAGAGRWQARIIVPVREHPSGVWRGFVGRAVDPRARRKYLYPAGMSRGELLYNSGALHVETDEPAYVVEGVFDALPHWPDAVACLGKPTAAQRELLRQARRPLVVVLDRDAWREGWALAQQLLLDGVRATFARLPDTCKDPGELTREQLLALS